MLGNTLPRLFLCRSLKKRNTATTLKWFTILCMKTGNKGENSAVHKPSRTAIHHLKPQLLYTLYEMQSTDE